MELGRLRELLLRLERISRSHYEDDRDLQIACAAVSGHESETKADAVRRVSRALRHEERRRVLELKRQAKLAA